MSKFTDNQLAQLYLKIATHYNSLKDSLSLGEIYPRLATQLNVELNNPGSALYWLDQDEKSKPFAVLNQFYWSCVNNRNALHEAPQFIVQFATINFQDPQWRHYHNHCYCPTNDALFTWLMLDSISHRRYAHYDDSGCFGRSHSHGHPSKDTEKTWLFLLLVVLATLLISLALIAAYYLFDQTLNCLERFQYNEGWLQGVITLSSAIASGAIAGVLASIFASTPLALFALGAGLSNPVGFAALGVVCLSLIGAGIGCFITNQIQSYVIKKCNADSLDPLDPHRLGLSHDEELNLAKLGYDIIAIKCALVAIHEQIGKNVPSRLNRIFGDEGKQVLLEKARELRRGEAGDWMAVGEGNDKQTFYLRSTLPAQVNESSPPPYNPEIYERQSRLYPVLPSVYPY